MLIYGLIPVLILTASFIAWLIGRVDRLEKQVSALEWELLRHRHE